MQEEFDFSRLQEEHSKVRETPLINQGFRVYGVELAVLCTLLVFSAPVQTGQFGQIV